MFDSICLSEPSEAMHLLSERATSSRHANVPINKLGYPESSGFASNSTIAGPKYMPTSIRTIMSKMDHRLQSKNIDITVNDRLARIREPVQARFDRMHYQKVKYGNLLTRDSYTRWQKRLDRQKQGIRSMFPGSAQNKIGNLLPNDSFDSTFRSRNWGDSYESMNPKFKISLQFKIPIDGQEALNQSEKANPKTDYG